MILTIDIGNSNICFAIHKENQKDPLFFERIHTDREKKAQDYRTEIEMLLQLHGMKGTEISKIALSSVVPCVTEHVKQAVQAVTGRWPLQMNHRLDLGFENHADYPETVGQDILADICGALEEHEAPLMIIDMGTATVISITLPAGAEPSTEIQGEMSPLPSLSGVIIQAGVRTGLNALTQNASQLPGVSLKAPEKVIGRNTVDSMKSGTIFGAASMIDGMIDHLEESTGLHFTVVATGGLSQFIVPYCTHEIVYDPNLLVKGLYRMLKRNVQF